MNTIILTGRLGKDIELKKTSNNTSVCQFSIANNTGYGEKQKTSWFFCKAWKQSAEFLSQYARKGDLVGVKGRLAIDESEKNGIKTYITYINCEDVELFSSKPKSENAKSELGDDLQRPEERNDFKYSDFKEDDLPFY